MSSPRFIPPPRRWKAGTECTRADLPPDFPRFIKMAEEDSSLHREGYRIELHPETFSLTVGSHRALRYAWQHFQQWQQGPETLCGMLEDAPDMDRRGFMLDISRCKVPTRESLETWVKILAGFRYNEFQLYTEHTFAYTGHETVWKDASPMEADDIRWLQSLCKAYGIELVPNQNCFGHFERWIKHEAYRKYAESPDGFITPWGEKRSVGSVLKPDQASLDLVKGLLDQLLPLFESPWVNIGCDETWELGQGASQARCDQEGGGKVYTDFVRAVMEYVKEKHGKQCQFWGDIIVKTPEQLQNLPPDALALEWGYEEDHPFMEDSRRFAESGLDFMICPGTSSWRSFAGRTENMLGNIRNAGQAAQQNGAKGMLLTDWGDNGHLQQSPVSYPALAWCGLQAWNTETAREADMERWCDEVAFAGHKGDTACWLAAGRVHDHLERKRFNGTSIFEIFQHPEKVASDVSSLNLQKTLEAITQLQEPKTFVLEWKQSLLNMRVALQTALEIKGEPQPSLSGLLAEARETQRNLWLQRNHKGGLAESLEMYTKLAKKINDGENQ